MVAAWRARRGSGVSFWVCRRSSGFLWVLLGFRPPGGFFFLCRAALLVCFGCCVLSGCFDSPSCFDGWSWLRLLAALRSAGFFPFFWLFPSALSVVPSSLFFVCVPPLCRFSCGRWGWGRWPVGAGRPRSAGSRGRPRRVALRRAVAFSLYCPRPLPLRPVLVLLLGVLAVSVFVLAWFRLASRVCGLPRPCGRRLAFLAVWRRLPQSCVFAFSSILLCPTTAKYCGGKFYMKPPR